MGCTSSRSVSHPPMQSPVDVVSNEWMFCARPKTTCERCGAEQPAKDDSTHNLSSGSSMGFNRSVSLLSTPSYHSSSSHPRNYLRLDPTLIPSPVPSASRYNKMDTDCASGFSRTSSVSPLLCLASPPLTKRNLTLDPTLFTTPVRNASSKLKMDTDSASRFSSTRSYTPSSSFSSIFSP